jgi:hypothetical protein
MFQMILLFCCSLLFSSSVSGIEKALLRSSELPILEELAHNFDYGVAWNAVAILRDVGVSDGGRGNLVLRAAKFGIDGAVKLGAVEGERLERAAQFLEALVFADPGLIVLKDSCEIRHIGLPKEKSAAHLRAAPRLDFRVQ